MIKWLTINGTVETFCLQLFTRTYHFFVKLSIQFFFFFLGQTNTYIKEMKSLQTDSKPERVSNFIKMVALTGTIKNNFMLVKSLDFLPIL